MRKRAWAAAAGLLVTILLSQLPASAGSRGPHDDPVVERLAALTRGTQWQHVDTIEFQFDAEHPQGMAKLGDRFFVSSVEIIEPTVPCPGGCGGYDRTPGRGAGHVFVVDPAGNLVADIELGEGHMYHPGGIDYDGRWLWVPVAEYRPNSSSIVYRVDPNTFAVAEVFRVRDHIGGVVRDRADGHIHGVSWASRTQYEWTAGGRQLVREPNPSHFIDYQDCDYHAYRKLVCGGIAGLVGPGGTFELGGLALIDLRSGEIEHEVPVLAFSPATGHVVTRNPVFLEPAGSGLRLYAGPDDDEQGAILVYETP